jgi:hypothetical protein
MRFERKFSRPRGEEVLPLVALKEQNRKTKKIKEKGKKLIWAHFFTAE